MNYVKIILLSFFVFSVYGQGIEQRLDKYITYEPGKPIGYLHIGMDRPIDNSTYIYIKFALEYFRKKGASFIVLDLNTPGGEVFAAQKIASLLQASDIQYNIPIIAFLDNWAISAGAMLAYSCRFIATTKGSSMGAAEPVTISTGQMESASEKVNSALRSEFMNLASFYERNPLIAEAMVDKDMILVERGGRFIKLEAEDEIESSDQIISQKGKLLTLNAEQLIAYGVADFTVFPTQVVPISREEKKAGSWPASKCLLFHYPYFQNMQGASLISFRDWKIGFFSFLSHPLIASLLFLGLMIGFYIEASTPGFGVAGALAIACLALILLSAFSVQAIHWIEIIILVIGLVLLALEIFVIPGFGIIGILGIALSIAGLFALMLPGLKDIHFSFDTGSFNLAAIDVVHKLIWLCSSLIIGFIIIALLAKYVMPRFALFSRLVSRGEQEASKGYVASPSIKTLPKVGQEGEVYSTLRPFGKILVEEEIYSAMSETGFVERGTKIVVMRIEGGNIIVRKK